MSATILVVDPSPVVRRQVAQSLGPVGFYVREARDGWEALDVASRESHDLVLCALDMPGMNGVEFLSAFREQDEASTPVVMLAAKVDPLLLSRARSYGAKGWIAKPFTTDLLVMAARKLTSTADVISFRSIEMPVRRAG